MIKSKKNSSKSKKSTHISFSEVVVSVYASFNNTIVSVSDTLGSVAIWSSSGACGFKGSRKSTPFAAQVAAEKLSTKLLESGVKTVHFRIKGPGGGRDSVIRAFGSSGIKIVSIVDVTPVPHNGCKPSKKRRI